MMQGLGTGADGAGGNKLSGVHSHRRPPKMLLDDSQRPLLPWVTGHTGGVTPFQDGRPEFWRAEQAVGRTVYKNLELCAALSTCCFTLHCAPPTTLMGGRIISSPESSVGIEHSAWRVGFLHGDFTGS